MACTGAWVTAYEMQMMGKRHMLFCCLLILTEVHVGRPDVSIIITVGLDLRWWASCMW